MASLTGLAVGDEVFICGYNYKKPTRAEVIKVGRKLVYVRPKGSNWVEKPYRIDTGVINDNYGHSWLKTPEMVAEDERRIEYLKALHNVGLEPRLGKTIPMEILERLVAALPEEVPGE